MRPRHPSSSCELGSNIGAHRQRPLSDDKPARIRAVALCDPNLPIDFLVSEREVITLLATDYAAAEIFAVDDLGHQLIVRIREEQVGSREGSVVFVFRLIHEMVDCSGDIDLSEDVSILAQYRQRLAVEHALDMCKSAEAVVKSYWVEPWQPYRNLPVQFSDCPL